MRRDVTVAHVRYQTPVNWGYPVQKKGSRKQTMQCETLSHPWDQHCKGTPSSIREGKIFTQGQRARSGEDTVPAWWPTRQFIFGAACWRIVLQGAWCSGGKAFGS